MKKDLNDDLLIRHLLGETTLAEEQEIDVWINANNDNARKLEQFKFLLESSKELTKDSPAGEDEQWEKFKKIRDTNHEHAVVPIHKAYKQWLQIAASLLLVCGLGTGGYYFFSHNMMATNTLVTIKTRNNVITHILPDGSTVQLNINSSISYSNNFGKERKLELTGEAFFNVKHNANIPFTVYANNVSIRDLGTSFNVKYKSGYLEVIVETGVVKVSKETASIVLKQHEMIHVSLADKKLIKQSTDDLLYRYYRNNRFELNNTPLSHIVSVFNEIYGDHIRIEGKSLNNIPLTVTLQKDSLDKMLHVLLLTTPEIKMKKNGDDIVITK